MRQIVWCLALAAAPLPAQTAPTPAPQDTGRTDVLVLDHLFESGLLEQVPVFLQKDAVYRAEIDHPGVELQWYTQPGDKPPYSIATDRELDPENRITYEVYPSQDETVQLRVVGGSPGEATHLRLYRDVRATKHREGIVHGPGWAVGVELQTDLRTSYSGGYVVNRGGMDLEGCFSFRAGPGIWSLLSGCVFGLEFVGNTGAHHLTYFFSEPRVQAWRHLTGKGRSSVEAGLLFRLALGNWSTKLGDSTDLGAPKYLGFGAYFARNIVTDSKGDGWSLLASAMYGYAGSESTSTGSRTVGFEAIRLGIGRYF